jgi:hypothetical protein
MSEQWWFALGKLGLAALCGLALTAANTLPRRPDRGLSGALEQAQILLCVTGALMMIIIGDSLARAFGIAGAAGIIRFRTPVENPRDTILLFLLLGIGMACGLGSFGVALLGTLLLCGLLLLLDRVPDRRLPRWTLEVAAAGGGISAARVQSLLNDAGVRADVRQIAAGDSCAVKFDVCLPAAASIQALNKALLEAESGIRELCWSAPKEKGRKKTGVDLKS